METFVFSSELLPLFCKLNSTFFICVIDAVVNQEIQSKLLYFFQLNCWKNYDKKVCFYRYVNILEFFNFFVELSNVFLHIMVCQAKLKNTQNHFQTGYLEHLIFKLK